MRKRLTSILLICVILTVLLAGCGKEKNDASSTIASQEITEKSENTSNMDANNASSKVVSQEVTNTIEEASTEEKETVLSSTPENDTDKGLRVVKLDDANELNDKQKMVLEYFDTDYLENFDYEGLRRTPQIFTNAQVAMAGSVVKVISMDDKNFQMLIWYRILDEEWARETFPDLKEEYVLVSGKTGNNWFMEGDDVVVKGKSTGVQNVTINGESYVLPTVEAYNVSLFDGRIKNGFAVNLLTKSYDLAFIKTVAETILGDVIVSKPAWNTDVTEDTAALLNRGDWIDITEDYVLVQVENQSNSKFNKFLFTKQGGEIIDIMDGPYDIYATKQQYLEFSPDFNHFFIFTYDEGLELLTLDYYDSNLNKIWKREFMETTSAKYDFTKNNIYLSANNELYIINTETGEDTFPPSYVGSKKAIRKLPEGIFMISESKSDGAMLIGLDGSIKWKTNLDYDVEEVNGLQLVDDKIIFYYTDTGYTGAEYVAIDKNDGKILASLQKTWD